MDKIKQVDQNIKEARQASDKLSENVPGLEYLEIEGVDQIPLGGDSSANRQKNKGNRD